MKLKVLSSQDMEMVREWRNDVMETLRTPFELTAEMQQDYYLKEICNRDSRTRYWGIWIQNQEEITNYENGETYYAEMEGMSFIGYGGIENIEWENSRGEISLLIGPDYRRQGFGEMAVEEILFKAFHLLGLSNVHGECYKCSPAVGFWERLVGKYHGYDYTFPRTKLYGGKFHGSYLFNFNIMGWEETHE